jgi:hypothetical protein
VLPPLRAWSQEQRHRRLAGQGSRLPERLLPVLQPLVLRERPQEALAPCTR